MDADILRRPLEELPTAIREQSIRDARRIVFWIPFLLTLYPAYYIFGLLGDFSEEYIGLFGAFFLLLFIALGLCYAAQKIPDPRWGRDHAQLGQRAV